MGHPADIKEPPSMGLRGLWATLSNMTAVALICLMFYQTISFERAQAAADRQAYREDLQRLTTAVDRLAREVQHMRRERGPQ